MSLDDDLAAWAATVRLPAAEADAIFQRIVTAPAGPAVVPPAGPGLDPSWWRDFTVGFTARIVASTAPVRLAA
jgi:hypothetical protein